MVVLATLAYRESVVRVAYEDHLGHPAHLDKMYVHGAIVEIFYVLMSFSSS